MRAIRNFIKNSKGATAIEYGLIAALIAVAAIGAMSALGPTLKNTFSNVSRLQTEKAGPAQAMRRPISLHGRRSIYSRNINQFWQRKQSLRGVNTGSASFRGPNFWRHL